MYLLVFLTYIPCSSTSLARGPLRSAATSASLFRTQKTIARWPGCSGSRDAEANSGPHLQLRAPMRLRGGKEQPPDSARSKKSSRRAAKRRYTAGTRSANGQPTKRSLRAARGQIGVLVTCNLRVPMWRSTASREAIALLTHHRELLVGPDEAAALTAQAAQSTQSSGNTGRNIEAAMAAELAQVDAALGRKTHGNASTAAVGPFEEGRLDLPGVIFIRCVAYYSWLEMSRHSQACVCNMRF